MKRRETFHHGDLREALVAAASTMVAERRGADISLREVAEAVGVSHTAAYRHFAAKADLLAEIARRGFEAMEATIDRAMEAAARNDGSAARSRLLTAGLAYVDFAETHPGYYRVMFLPGLCDRSRHPALGQAAEDAFERLVDLVVNEQRNGRVRSDTAAVLVASSLWAAEHGYAGLLLDGQFDERPQGGAGAPPADRCVLISALVAGFSI